MDEPMEVNQVMLEGEESFSNGILSQPINQVMLEGEESFSNGILSQPSSSSQSEDNMTPSTSHSSEKFHVDTNLIPQAQEENEELKGLGLNIYNQEDLEQGIIAQVDEALAKEEEQRIKRLLEKQLSDVLDDIRLSRDELEKIGRVIRSATRSNPVEITKDAKKLIEAANRQRENKLKQMKKLKAKRGALLMKLDGKEIDSELVSNDEDLQFFNEALSGNTVPTETEQERLIKLGEMTPFGTVMQTAIPVPPTPPPKPAAPSDFELFLQNKDSSSVSKKGKALKNKPLMNGKSSKLHTLLTDPNKSSYLSSLQASTNGKLNMFDDKDKIALFRERHKKNLLGKKKKKVSELKRTVDDRVKKEEWKAGSGSEDEWRPSGDEEDDEPSTRKRKKPSTPMDSDRNEEELGTKPGKQRLEKSTSAPRARDDGNYAYFQKRIKTYHKLEAARKKKQHDEGISDSEDEETEFEGGLKVPGTLWKKLFGYQRTGVKWLWELHCQLSGGIIGDEMGLGKTIQTIAFMAALKVSRLKQRPFRYVGLGPTIIVCPATMMHQWVREFHKWWPEFRVAVLHSSGSHTGSEDNLIHNIVNQHGVLVTSYTTLVHQQDSLLHHDWHYIILDEGHKIRNPDAQVTQACKQFRTPHRIILSGSPIQNNLKELWSLFDFIFPGKLGTLPDFMAHFSVPIVQGGYANASQVQVQTAYKCACILRDTINPYLLRRMKADVKSAVNLPGKTEQVLFCRLTDEQRDVYQEYLDSKECNAILAGKYKVFAGLITLRKICNHPDISTGGPRVLVGQSTNGDESLEYGYWRRSGKFIVVEALLKLWKQQGQRVLLFSQSKMMLDILESFMVTSGYSFLRMDGGTSISARQPLIQKYNNSPDIFLFLLTTRVGGLGVNLTGANRVVIFDPDWNPSTDTQARERAWRIGQNKQVTIYRLLTTGTIEEKIYHRQIFKQFLTNRVLKDPKQRRFFKTNDLFELFTLGTKDDQNGTETGAIFAGTGSEVKMDKHRNRFDEMKKEALPVGKKKPQEKAAPIPDERTQKLRELARKLSEKMSQNAGQKSNEKSKKKKKKSKRPKDAVCEGEKIPHLAKLDNYQSGGKTDNEQLSTQQDDYVLKRLFKKTGIQGALKHDVIVGADKVDYALVEGEAERVARDAAAALKQSRQHCSNALSGIPNWTGNSGGGQPARPRFGKKKNSLLVKSKPAELKTTGSIPDEKQSPSKTFDGSLAGNRTDVSLFSSSNQVVMSSSELLGRMRARKVVRDNADVPVPVSTESQNEGENKDIELVTDIRNFIAFQCHIDGQASTQELLDEFGIKLPPGDSAKFKAMLRQICDFYRSADAGVWQLKPEYR